MTSLDPILATADLCDAYPQDAVWIAKSFRSFGGVSAVCGRTEIITVDQTIAPVRKALEADGEERILFVDAGAIVSSAVFGDNLAGLAIENGWRGAIVNGAIRDSGQLSLMKLGIFALGTCPVRAPLSKEPRDLQEIAIGDARITSGDIVFADQDGVVVVREVSPRFEEISRRLSL